jgi:hypothetical protein
MSKRLLVLLPAVGLVAGLLSGCVQMPTEKQGVSDLRPQLSFKIADENLRAARVMVDGLDMGAVGDYAEGAAVLRVLSGTHVVRVYASGVQILEEKIYVGDGVNRAILVK